MRKFKRRAVETTCRLKLDETNKKNKIKQTKQFKVSNTNNYGLLPTGYFSCDQCCWHWFQGASEAVRTPGARLPRLGVVRTPGVCLPRLGNLVTHFLRLPILARLSQDYLNHYFGHSLCLQPMPLEPHILEVHKDQVPDLPYLNATTWASHEFLHNPTTRRALSSVH